MLPEGNCKKKNHTIHSTLTHRLLPKKWIKKLEEKTFIHREKRYIFNVYKNQNDKMFSTCE